jgi:hypothetical protein
MSVLDEFRGLESRVAQRMKELRPLVDEYRELEHIAARIGLSDDRASAPANATGQNNRSRRGRAKASGTAAPRRGSAGRSKPRGAVKRSSASGRASVAGAGQRRQQVLEAVATRPGITVREIGEQLGVDPTSLYRSVRELERGGEIEKRGTALHLA